MNLVYVNNDRPITDSLIVAETFGKEHRRVMQDIREMDCSQEFNEHHFVLTSYQDAMNREKPKYLITQDGFSFLVMGYTGKEAARFKEMYINEFNLMKSKLNIEQLHQQFDLPRNYSEALRLAANLSEENETVKLENQALTIESAEQKQKLKEQETPIAIYNLAIKAGNTLSMQEVAKSLGTGRTKLYNFLREKEIIMKHSTLPYQRFMDAGYFKVTERPRTSGDTIVNDPATRVTAKGFDYIAKLLTAN